MVACAATLGLLGIAPAAAGATSTPTSSTAAGSSPSSTGTSSAPAPSAGTLTPAWSFVPLSASPDRLTRSSIHLIAKPGQAVSDVAVLTNYSTQALDFDIYPSDAYNTKKLGAFTLNTPNIKEVAVGTWISLPVNIYNLPPRTATEFKFTVKVPVNASPGDHVGGIVALNTVQPVKQEPGTSIAVQRGEGIAVYVRVPGPLHAGVAAANIGATMSTPAIGFGSGWARVHYQVDNTGNVVLNGHANLEAVNVFGSVIKRFPPVTIDALIPGQSMALVEPRWTGLPFAGPVHLKVIMTTTSVNGTGEAVVWVFPWLLFLLIVLVIVALVALWIWRRRKRRAESMPAEASGGPDAPAPKEPAAVG